MPARTAGGLDAMVEMSAWYARAGCPIDPRDQATYRAPTMLLPWRTGAGGRRPMLLALVFGVVLVLVGMTASALVAVASDNLRKATLSGVVTRDASLVELFVNGNLRSNDLDPDGPTAARVAELSRLLGSLSVRDGIMRVEIRDLDGRVVASSEPGVIGRAMGDSSGMQRAADGDPDATLIEAAQPLATVELANADGAMQEFLPIVNQQGDVIAVVAMWRDA